MARQQRLLQDLQPPRPVLNVAPEELAARRVAEQQAIDAAFERLAAGDLHAASALLDPHVDGAQDTRTLTTMSRIRSSSGRFEEALDLLQRAESVDPSDNKVAYFMAELLQLMGRHHAAIAYRRRIAFTTRDAPAAAFLRLIATIVKASSSGKSALVSELRVALTGLRKAPDVAPQNLSDAAGLIYNIKAMAKEALALQAEADPCATDEAESVARWMTLPGWCTTEGRPLARMLDQGESGRRPSMAELADVVVHPALQWVPIVGPGAPTLFSGLAPGRIRLRNEDPASPLLLSNASKAVIRLPRTLRRVDELALLVGGNGNYYHDTVDFVSALAIAEGLGIDRRVPLVVNAEPAPHLIELLGLLGYGDSRLFKVGRDAPMHFDRLLVTSRLAAGGQWFDPMLAAWYRRRLVEPLGEPPVSRRKLYLSRAGTTRRRLSNEAEVVAALEPLGYEIIRPEAMSVREQLTLFAQASHIVGATGAALTNMIYAPRGAQVVVLQNKQLVQGGGDLYFDALAASCGHQVATLECELARLAAGERSIDADLVADVGLLLRCPI